ncbi:MAG: PIG-L family deacetylase [Dehalococcoidia bacterium]|nr:PIG-L family deacetylase [Dehalococcoidia bacterium]
MTDPSNQKYEEPPAPPKVMAIHAHPDDQEFTMGGTLAKWAAAGSEIITVCVTSGDAGSNKYTPDSMTREKLAPIREQEQRNACQVLGVKDVLFMGYPDGMLEPSIGLRRELTRLIRKHRPDAVLCSDPTVRFHGDNYMNHPDHRAAADAALDAVFPSAGTRFIFPELLEEGLKPHEVSSVFLFGSEKPNVFIDISSAIETKLAALREHKSQLGEWDPSKMLSGWAKEQGKAYGMEAAEAFKRMVLGRP